MATALAGAVRTRHCAVRRILCRAESPGLVGLRVQPSLSHSPHSPQALLGGIPLHLSLPYFRTFPFRSVSSRFLLSFFRLCASSRTLGFMILNRESTESFCSFNFRTRRYRSPSRRRYSPPLRRHHHRRRNTPCRTRTRTSMAAMQAPRSTTMNTASARPSIPAASPS